MYKRESIFCDDQGRLDVLKMFLGSTLHQLTSLILYILLITVKTRTSFSLFETYNSYANTHARQSTDSEPLKRSNPFA